MDTHRRNSIHPTSSHAWMERVLTFHGKGPFLVLFFYFLDSSTDLYIDEKC